MNLPEDILKNYLNTDYSFTDSDRTIVIHLDGPNPKFLDYLKEEHISDWAYITAWNPTSFPQTEEFNRQLQQELLEKLQGYSVCKGERKGRDGESPAEESFFVAGINREAAAHLGWDFGQHAILVNGENGKPELLACPPMLKSPL